MTYTIANALPSLKGSASAIILGALLVSCSSGGERPANYSAKAEKALSNGKTVAAVSSAEAAVEADPRNAAYRSTLAQAYLADGRFMSAQETIKDAIELGDVSPRNVITLVLTQIAAGQQRDSIATLSQYRSMLPAGDYGLAMALSGQTRQGVSVLENEVREGSNSAKVRQNLAYAYALDGRWREARSMATQDVSSADADKRILQWAQTSAPEAFQERVAELIGVTPKMDSGQPMRLALSNTPAVDVAVAEIAAAPQPAETVSKEGRVIIQAPVKTTQLAMAGAAEDSVAVAPLISAMQSPVKVSPPVAAPVKAAPVNPAKDKDVPFAIRAMGDYVPSAKKVPIVEEAVPVKPAPVKPAKAVTTAKAVAPSAPGRVSNGKYIVQLGAFSSPAKAKNAWGVYTNKYSSLKDFDYASSSVKSGGRTLTRLAATGFGNAESAMDMCKGIKARGGNCIVREVGSSKPVRAGSRMAARK